MSTITAQFQSFCPACRQDVLPGAAITNQVSSGWAGTYLHAACAGAGAPVTYARRLAEVKALSHERARAVAMHLGSIVTRTKKYMGHSEVCYRAASVPGVSDEKWAAAMTMVGKKSAAGTTTTETAAPPVFPATPAKAELDTAQLAEIIAAVTKKAREEAKAAAEEAVRASATPKEFKVKVGDAAPKTIAGKVHAQFGRLLKMVAARVNVWLAGPAGSGKTTAAQQVAEALSLPFFFNGAIDTEYKLSGFVDAQGKIVSTAFRRAYTEGGVYLFDEVDASMPSAVLAFNAALSNGHADFPGLDTPVGAHPDFRVIAAGNTWGFGATTEYVGRAKMDAAFLDRFVQLEWGYDEILEQHLATDTKWCARVQALRARARARGLKIVISPRATINGCKLLDAGMSWDEVETATVRAKISAQDWANLTN